RLGELQHSRCRSAWPKHRCGKYRRTIWPKRLGLLGPALLFLSTGIYGHLGYEPTNRSSSRTVLGLPIIHRIIGSLATLSCEQGRWRNIRFTVSLNSEDNMHFHTPISTMVKPPKMTTANVALRLFVTLAAICHVAAAHASLGGDSASVEADRAHMNVKHAARLTLS